MKTTKKVVMALALAFVMVLGFAGCSLFNPRYSVTFQNDLLMYNTTTTVSQLKLINMSTNATYAASSTIRTGDSYMFADLDEGLYSFDFYLTSNKGTDHLYSTSFSVTYDKVYSLYDNLDSIYFY